VLDSDEPPVEYPLDIVVIVSGDKVPEIACLFVSVNFNGSKNEK
jgi:hypothetical protein